MIESKCTEHDSYEPDCDACNDFVARFLEDNADLMDDLARLEEAEKEALAELDKKKNVK